MTDVYEKVLIKNELNLTLDELFVAYVLYYLKRDIKVYGVEKARTKDAYKTYLHLLDKYKSDLNKLISDITVAIDKNLIETLIPLSPHSIEKLVKSKLFDELISKGSYVVNEKEFQKLFVDKHDALKELLDIFRNVYLQINNSRIPVVNISHYDTLTENYAKAINNSTVTHDKVIEICKSAIERNLVTAGIEKIIESRMWLTWEQQDKKDEPLIKINRF